MKKGLNADRAKEDELTNHFVDSIGFTKHHFLVFILTCLILIINGMQIIMQAFLLSLLSQVEAINVKDIAFINFFENIGYSLSYITIMIFGSKLKSKITIQILSVMCLCFNGLTMIVFKYKYLVIIRMFIGYCLGALDILIFVMLLEMCANKIRGFMSSIILIFNPLGQVIASLIAFWQLDEDHIENNYNILVKVPFFILLIVVLLVIFIQENPRRLFEEKEYEKGITTYANNKVSGLLRQKTSNFQRKESENLIETPHLENLNFTNLFGSSPLKYTITIIIFSLICGFIHNGIYFILPTNAPKLNRHEVSKLILSVAVDIPSTIFVSIFIDSKLLGRLKSIWLGFIVTAVFSALAFVSENIFFMIMIKFGINMSIAAVIVYSCELYPKNLRTSIVALFNLGKRLSIMISPLIITYISETLEEKYAYIVFIILSLLCLILGYSFTIETKDKALDDFEVLDN